MTAEWGDVAIGTLRRMWAAGATARGITDALNRQPDSGHAFTRNGVIGKAHRLLLDRRPNPIRSQVKNPNSKRYNRARRLPDLFDTRPSRAHPAPNAQRDEVPRGCSESETAGPDRVDSGVTPARRTVPRDGGTTTLADAKPHQCRFPTGGGHGGSLAVCGHPVATPGLSWCRHHAERCFQKRADLPAVPPVLRWSMAGVNAA